MRPLKHRHRAGNADRAPRADRIERVHGLTRRSEEHVGRGTARRDFTSIVGDDVTARRIVVHHEGAASETRGLRLDETEHGLHGDRGIHSRATGFQDLDAGIDRERIRRGDHAARRPGTIRFRFDDRRGRAILRCSIFILRAATTGTARDDSARKEQTKCGSSKRV